MIAKIIKRETMSNYSMQGRKSNTLFMPGRKPKFAGKKTKWEIKREKRPAKRIRQGKLPLAEPLTIAPVQERMAAFKRGKMVFYDGERRIELPLLTRIELPPFLMEERIKLAGVYKVPSSGIFTFRVGSTHVLVHELQYTPQGFVENLMPVGFFLIPHLAHMELKRVDLRGYGLGIKGVSKAEKHQRAMHEGKYSFEMLPKFQKIFTKLGYKGTVQQGHRGKTFFLMKKVGKVQPKDNLFKFYRIEAIDPKNGKARVFTFPIKGTDKR